MAKLVDLDHKWATLIGRGFIAFGHIESCSYACILAFMPDIAAKHLNKRNLASRLEVLRDVARELDIAEPHRLRFLALIDDVRELAETRNLIAHNPLVLNIFEEDEEVFSKEMIMSNKSPSKRLEFAELTRYAESAEALSTEFHAIMAVLRGQSDCMKEASI